MKSTFYRFAAPAAWRFHARLDCGRGGRIRRRHAEGFRPGRLWLRPRRRGRFRVQLRQREERVMSALLSSALTWVQSFFKGAQPVIQAVETADPALAKNVTLTDIMKGVTVANGLPWSDIGKNLSEKFRDPGEAALTVEDIAKAIAPILPEAVYVEDIAAVVVVLANLGLIKAAPAMTPEQAKQVAAGINPFSGAPLFT